MKAAAMELGVREEERLRGEAMTKRTIELSRMREVRQELAAEKLADEARPASGE